MATKIRLKVTDKGAALEIHGPVGKNLAALMAAREMSDDDFESDYIDDDRFLDMIGWAVDAELGWVGDQTAHRIAATMLGHILCEYDGHELTFAQVESVDGSMALERVASEWIKKAGPPNAEGEAYFKRAVNAAIRFDKSECKDAIVAATAAFGIVRSEGT